MRIIFVFKKICKNKARKPKKHIFLIFQLLLVFSFLFSEQISNARSLDLSNNEDLSAQDLREIALDIAFGLLDDAILTKKHANWPRIIDFPPPEWMGGWYQNYYGYNWGSAGIADTLLKFYSVFGTKTFLDYAEYAANYILDGAQNFEEGGLFWYPYGTSGTAYSGMKYGNAGIAQFFLHLYEQTNNETYLNALENALKPFEIKANENSSSNEAHWGFTLGNSEAVSDITYGTSGIASVFLEAGLSLNKTKWINLAVNSGRWLENISITEVNNEIPTMAVPWSVPSFSDNEFYTGYGTGNAGVGSFFIKLYKGVRDFRWMENAKKIGNWLLQEKINKTWINGGVSYATDLDENSTITGMDSGASGVGQFLLELFNQSREEKYAEAAIDVATWLLKNKNTTGVGIKWPKTTTEGIDNETYLTGYSYGAAGIGTFFSELFKFFGCLQFKETMLGAAEWLESLRDRKDRFPVAIGITRHPWFLNQYGHHLSYYEGAAGIALFFLNAADKYNSSSLYQEIVSCNQFSSGDHSSVTLNDPLEGILFAGFGLLIVSIIVFFVSVISRKKVGKQI